jgi:hypothetical protein
MTASSTQEPPQGNASLGRCRSDPAENVCDASPHRASPRHADTPNGAEICDSGNEASYQFDHVRNLVPKGRCFLGASHGVDLRHSFGVGGGAVADANVSSGHTVPACDPFRSRCFVSRSAEGVYTRLVVIGVEHALAKSRQRHNRWPNGLSGEHFLPKGASDQESWGRLKVNPNQESARPIEQAHFAPRQPSFDCSRKGTASAASGGRE